MPQVAWTPIAESDLDEIIYYISFVDRRPATGTRIYYEIRDSVDRLAEMNIPGQSHPAAPQGWLYFKYKRWLIFYQTRPDRLEVMRVVDAVRDLPHHLKGP